MLIAVVSVMLYHYIRVTVFQSVVSELNQQATAYKNNPQNFNPNNLKTFTIEIPNKTLATVKAGELKGEKPYLVMRKIKDESITTLTTRLDDSSYLVLEKETTLQSRIVEEIFIDIIIVNVTAILLVLFYALFLSRMLLIPIKILSHKLTNLDEKFLKEIDIKSLPDEFLPLGNSINRLITRIQTFVLYQKELFVGVAHELKTPLAVMKTKNEVTLLKPRESEKYIEALKSNNEAINGMNAMIGSVLEIGRQEGAQFEEPVNTDVIAFLKKLGKNYEVLAKGDEKHLVLDLKPEIFNLNIQTSLLTHIVQNFVQNAIKFSPKNSTITISSRLEKSKFIIEVTDEGMGIDESKDLFAPFKRYGNKGGAGLGLFLAKGAAQALGAEISIKNREGASGAVASLVLNLKG
ncbi:MAG: HAMP domain-containing histidine kinase [Campylobacter concisus]|uniref:sensor histidine kinase n=1 Tax=Campylobacter concisus TaxID=199 RepID=UPI0018843829|nr:HAMP domain-containing sensor histidine kinase [Campylobacter concisus]MBE9835468.1 HAMP domain-containing histidine kinase [Campylobacter concisus]MBE9857057.1 HAMP domain-containing histidine kinase [Campylobacter concisus]MBF0923368.1 HAMP domain-containing histidine kinase [Campylobacter concisus]